MTMKTVTSKQFKHHLDSENALLLIIVIALLCLIIIVSVIAVFFAKDLVKMIGYISASSVHRFIAMLNAR